VFPSWSLGTRKKIINAAIALFEELGKKFLFFIHQGLYQQIVSKLPWRSQ
jgi:uncharacterized membrane protein